MGWNLCLSIPRLVNKYNMKVTFMTVVMIAYQDYSSRELAIGDEVRYTVSQESIFIILTTYYTHNVFVLVFMLQ